VIFHEIKQDQPDRFGPMLLHGMIACQQVTYPGGEYPRYQGESVPPAQNPNSPITIVGFRKVPCLVAASIFSPLPADESATLGYNGLHYKAFIPWTITFAIPVDRPAVSILEQDVHAQGFRFKLEEVLLGRYLTTFYFSTSSLQSDSLRFQSSPVMPTTVNLRDQQGVIYPHRGGGGGDGSFTFQFGPIPVGIDELTLSGDSISLNVRGEVTVPLP
jgi:hypothetical protein